MKSYLRFIEKLSKMMNVIAGTALTFIMLLTVADVVLRYLGMPIVGTFEIVGLGGAIVVGFGIPAIIKLGYDPLWFGILISITVMMGVVIPPHGHMRFRCQTDHKNTFQCRICGRLSFSYQSIGRRDHRLHVSRNRHLVAVCLNAGRMIPRFRSMLMNFARLTLNFEILYNCASSNATKTNMQRNHP